ncbi:DUF3305 domain-containing protein [Rubritepida flocculans]|uniref:DUF3305 domain-containing protein n=1 Tax=Rubritepida flocculans TaxID=182403 RepID=UPI0004006811|nr:DUF3305 domain-containing protein [Rubritepida flocculans]
MDALPPELEIPVAILAERRPGATPWQEHVWRAAAVLEEAPPVPPWTKLREEAGRELFFAGTAPVRLHRTDTPNYRENLTAAEPRLWALLRESGAGMELAAVTVDPGEAEVLAEDPRALLEALPLPPGLQALLAAFVAQHHVEREFHKRKRDRQDPDSLGRRGRV